MKTTMRIRPINITGRSVSTEQMLTHPVGTIFTLSYKGQWLAQMIVSPSMIVSSCWPQASETEAVALVRERAVALTTPYQPAAESRLAA